ARVPAAQERRVSRLAPADTRSGKGAQRLRQWPSDRYLDERPTAVGVDGEGTVARGEGGDLLLERDRERRRDAAPDVGHERGRVLERVHDRRRHGRVGRERGDEEVVAEV